MTLTSTTQATERIESLKIGIVGSIAAGVAVLLITLIHFGLAHEFTASSVLADLLTVRTVLSIAIGVLSGFLFSVTYRYVIRQNKNPQLKSGTIMAFGLVRGLAQVEVKVEPQALIWQQGLPVVESLLLFAIVALSLNWAFAAGWVKRMDGGAEE